MIGIVQAVSRFAIPVFIIFISAIGFYRKVPVYEAFIEGAKEGLTTVVRILPYLTAMLTAIGVFRSSGAMELLIQLVSPLTELAGIPAELLPLAFMRPLSGSASIGILAEMLRTYGADSFIGRTASTMMGSTETTLYTAGNIFRFCWNQGYKVYTGSRPVRGFYGICGICRRLLNSIRQLRQCLT